MREERRTLTRYTIESEHRHPGSTGDFSGLLNAVATAVKIISNQVSRGALAGPLGAENVQGDVQQKLDLISHEVMIGETEWAGHLAAMASAAMASKTPTATHSSRRCRAVVSETTRPVICSASSHEHPVARRTMMTIKQSRSDLRGR